VYELTSTEYRQAIDWRHTLELNDSQIAAYALIAIAHLLNALPENPTEVIVGVIALRRRMTDEASPAAAAEGGHVASTHIGLQQAATRRVAPGSTARNTVEHNNK